MFQILSMTAEEFQAHEERLADFDRLEEDVEEDFYDDIYEDILTFGEFLSPIIFIHFWPLA